MRWSVLAKPNKDTVTNLCRDLGVDEPIGILLAQRGIGSYEEARAFFRPEPTQLHNPFLMKDMDKAVARIQMALTAKERILVYGDYDVDGTTAVSLLYSFLSQHSPYVATYIPDRYTEGYGISYQGIDFASDNGISLIITLDCGIKAVDKVVYATEKGIDFIICDHHRPSDILPPAIAVLDPKREDCNYPYKELCGCGVGFKLVQALHESQGGNLNDLESFLDLVAIATCADIVPLTGENRVLTSLGLKQINSAPRPGVKALISNLKKEISVTDLVFVVAPRINAAGRMKHASHALRLLTEEDLNIAIEWAREIESFNSDRRDADLLITEQALEQIEQNREQARLSTVVYQDDWHKGVIGIVASRLIETYYRPTLVFTKSEDKLAASARSIRGFDIYEALEACSDYLLQFGGHTYAAGLTMLEENYEGFKNHFEAVVSNTLPRDLLQPKLLIDLPLSLDQINMKLFRILKQFAPFGPKNMMPVFIAEDVYDTGKSRPVGVDGKHLKLSLRQKNSDEFAGIAFNMGSFYDKINKGQPFSIAYSLDENEWNGNLSMQLKVRDIQLRN